MKKHFRNADISKSRAVEPLLKRRGTFQSVINTKSLPLMVWVCVSAYELGSWKAQSLLKNMKKNVFTAIYACRRFLVKCVHTEQYPHYNNVSSCPVYSCTGIKPDITSLMRSSKMSSLCLMEWECLASVGSPSSAGTVPSNACSFSVRMRTENKLSWEDCANYICFQISRP